MPGGPLIYLDSLLEIFALFWGGGRELFLPCVPVRKTRVGERLVRSFSHQTRDRKELATKQFVLPKLKISESTKVFLGSF